MNDNFLFVWEGVFEDYTPGLAFAIAKTKEEAVDLVMMDRTSVPVYAESEKKELLEAECDIYPLSNGLKVAYSVSGGG